MIAFAVGRFVEPGCPRGGWRLVHRTLGLCRACLQPRVAGSKNFCECHRAKHAAASNAWGKRHPEHHRKRVAAWRAQRRGSS